MLTSITPTATQAAPQLPTVTFSIASTLLYDDYIVDCDAGDEHHLELVQALVPCFLNTFPARQIHNALVQLNPVVLLVKGEDADGIPRIDIPTLSLDDLEAVRWTTLNGGLPGAVPEDTSAVTDWNLELA